MTPKALTAGCAHRLKKEAGQLLVLQMLPRLELTGNCCFHMLSEPTGLLPNRIIGSEIIADFLLFWLNRQREFRYVEALGLPAPTDRIDEVLYRIAMDHNFMHNIRLPGCKPNAAYDWLTKKNQDQASNQN